MPGIPDDVKRTRVREFLTDPKNQKLSDRAVAEEAGVSRSLVVLVRRQLIAEGRHPDMADLGQLVGRNGSKREATAYQDGTSARGGYVWVGTRAITKDEYRKMQRAQKAAARRGKQAAPRPSNGKAIGKVVKPRKKTG